MTASRLFLGRTAGRRLVRLAHVHEVLIRLVRKTRRSNRITTTRGYPPGSAEALRTVARGFPDDGLRPMPRDPD